MTQIYKKTSIIVMDSLKRRRDDDGGVDPATLGTKEHTLFLGALSEKTTEYQLSRIFKAYGPIVRLDILFHKFGPKRGQPRGYGFVELSTRECASSAREALDGFVLNDRAMVVRFVSDRILYDGGMPAEASSVTARAGGVVKSGREYLTESEREADRVAATARDTTHSVATNKVMAATLESKLAAIKARLGLSSTPTPTLALQKAASARPPDSTGPRPPLPIAPALGSVRPSG